MKTPLIPTDETKNFPVGEPSNEVFVWLSPTEETTCLVTGRDYSGKDPAIQFPRGWHVNASHGGQGAHGDFHQDLNAFSPELCRVVEREEVNWIRLEGGNFAKVELAHFFEPVQWADQCGIAVHIQFLASDELMIPLYQNWELRGQLNFAARKNESTECFGLHMTYDGLMPAYYKDAVNGSGLEKRIQPRFVVPIERNQMYRLMLTLEPTDHADEWAATAKLRTGGKKVWAFETHAGNHPNNIHAVSHFCFGDERRRDNSGGVFYYKTVEAWKYDKQAG